MNKHWIEMSDEEKEEIILTACGEADKDQQDVIGCSNWMEYGKKLGYWNYFKNQVIREHDTTKIIPKGWREGQFFFNFFQWLKKDKGISGNQNESMADPFNISDEEFKAYLKEYSELMIRG